MEGREAEKVLGGMEGREPSAGAGGTPRPHPGGALSSATDFYWGPEIPGAPGPER